MWDPLRKEDDFQECFHQTDGYFDQRYESNTQASSNYSSPEQPKAQLHIVKRRYSFQWMFFFALSSWLCVLALLSGIMEKYNTTCRAQEVFIRTCFIFSVQEYHKLIPLYYLAYFIPDHRAAWILSLFSNETLEMFNSTHATLYIIFVVGFILIPIEFFFKHFRLVEKQFKKLLAKQCSGIFMVLPMLIVCFPFIVTVIFFGWIVDFVRYTLDQSTQYSLVLTTDLLNMFTNRLQLLTQKTIKIIEYQEQANDSGPTLRRRQL